MTGQASGHPKMRLQHYAAKTHSLSSPSSDSLSVCLAVFIHKGHQVYVSKSSSRWHSPYDFPMNGILRCRILGAQSVCSSRYSVPSVSSGALDSGKLEEIHAAHTQKRQMRPVVNPSQCYIALPMSHLPLVDFFLLLLILLVSRLCYWFNTPSKICVCGWPTLVSMDGGGLH